MRTLSRLLAAAGIATLQHLAFAAPNVLSVSPSSQSLVALTTSQITVTFDGPMDVSTLNSSNIMVFGKWSGVAAGIFTFEENNTRVRFSPSGSFSAGEMVMVSISKNARNQAGEALVKGYTWHFWVRTFPGTLSLTETGRIPVRLPGESQIQTYGANAPDLNGDGFNDFFVPNEISNDCRVFLNDGAGNYSTFTVYPIQNGSRPSTNGSADFNGDGKVDIAVGNSTSDSVTVFIGNGLGGFSSIKNYWAAGGIRGLTVADLDGDGDADIVTANRSGNNIALLLNNGNGTFASRTVMEANGSGETACAAADANGDGVLDLFVGAYASSEIILLLGNGTGGFSFSSKVSAGGNGPWMIAVGDVNGDGNVDVVSANSGSSNCSVVLGNGLGGLSAAVTYPTNSFPIAIDLGDIDGDGDLDLVASNFTGRNWNIFENNGNGVFGNRRSLPAASAGSCATLHDRDNDGDMDMTGIDEIADLIFLFENRPLTGVSTSQSVPAMFALHQNYPNPFNPETEIRFDVQATSSVSIRVYDLLGKEVKLLVNKELHSGGHSIRWDGTDDSGKLVASGMYFYRMIAQSRDHHFSGMNKLLLLR